MTTKRVARCSIYEERPPLCRDYPTVNHYTPPECTFSFIDGERFGECACDIGACCATPREKGLPGGAVMPKEAGGLPCQHLVYVDVEVEEPTKLASGPNRSRIIKGAIGQ